MAGNAEDLAVVSPIDASDSELPASVARLASMVRRAREKRGWSQTTLAETAHVDHDVIHRLETGKSDPPFSLVADLVRILGLSLEAAVFNQQVAKRMREAAEEGKESSSS